jgi:outer membrane protein TolC
VRDAEEQTVLEVRSRYRTLSEKRALLNVARRAQASSREKLRVRTNQFQVQAAMLQDVLAVRAELAESDDHYEQALLAFWTAKADYDLAVGEEVLR